MAVDYKNLMANSLLEINQNKRLEKITVSDIQRASGISRQTFYNHFSDIFDLIQYTYKKKIVVHWDPYDASLDFCDHLIEDLSKTMIYSGFLRDAFDMHGPNNLMDYMVQYCIDFELKWMQTLYGETEMPEDLKNAVVFAAGGAMYYKNQWIRNGIDRNVLEITRIIIENEHRCLTQLFFSNMEDGPFAAATRKINMILASKY